MNTVISFLVNDKIYRILAYSYLQNDQGFVQYMDQFNMDRESKHLVFQMQKSRLKFVRNNID